MRCFLLLLMIASTCYATCPNSGLIFRNSEWVSNNLIAKLFNFFYDTIALTSEDSCSPAKRFVSIFSLVKTIYVTTNCTDIGRAIAIAKYKAKKQLKNTSAAIAGTFRGAVDRILNVIDQPMNDIFTACTPDTYEEECQNALKDMRAKKERQCSGYLKHVNFHNRVSRWAGNLQSIAYINDVITTSTKGYNDSSVLDYFENIVSKYKSTFQELRALFMSVKNDAYNCNVLSFTDSMCG